jgi:predicted helicase
MHLGFRKILKQYRDKAFSERDKGDRFERLMQAYLQTDPKYAYQFKHVWMWNNFPCKNDFGGKDTGIDLVAYTHTGDYWAIQCKFFEEGSIIDKSALDSFLSTSSKQFMDVDTLKTVGFSQRLWISTTNRWGSTAQETVKNQIPPFTRINFTDLENAPVDWEKLAKGLYGEQSQEKKKELFPHQSVALEKAHEHYKTSDRGQLIMACGTGKTFASLRIAENETNGNGLVLFLVPSIALLGQTLNAWTADAKEPINPICICSDPKVSRRQLMNDDVDTFSIVDLALPASTNVKTITRQFNAFKQLQTKGMTVVFSTYQSIDVIAEAQQELLKQDYSDNPYGVFDLIVCDEAHRTTGVTLSGDDESAFVKVHDNDFLRAKKRLYMTATPRLYSDDSKSKAAQHDAELCSMDDPSKFGDEIYRIGFGEAVEKDLLSDYKVLILTMSDKDVPEAVQKAIANKESEINYDDASKLIGVINALSKQILGDEGILKQTDPDPMKRGVAFCPNIKFSKRVTNQFNETTKIYLNSLDTNTKKEMVTVAAKHIDGTMGAPERDELLNWLKSDDGVEGECKVLTNVRCLSEGVDVPSLDSVMFLSARNSQVDVVQSVGRVMRKAPNKKYGYIIIPIVIPSDVEPKKALDDNERFKVVWSVLNALRAHDDRFNATVNKIELNKKRPNQIFVGTIGGREQSGGDDIGETTREINQQLAMQFEQLQGIVFAKMVQKVGDRTYWEQWAKNVADIAERQIARITNLIDGDGTHKEAFENFLNGLQNNINPSITKREAVEMLSQHIITKPVFEALFVGYSFVESNAISVSMQTMLELLEAQAIEKDTETLQKFYDSVKTRAEGIDNAEGKQRIIIELYDKFFKTAFPKMVEQLGIVYTPVEVVDFIIHSVNDVLKKEFNRSLSDENIHILDPFTGTGTFITRLLQSGLIEKTDLPRKYKFELHANEIVLLAYYIAAVNIENAYHDLLGAETEYESFEGIVLTDTFQMTENANRDKLFSEMFPQNSERVEAQKKTPLRIIFGNPPYSVGQKSANDNAQNQIYPKLDERIARTYAAASNAGLNKSLYDAYIKAFRWSSDRLDKNGGIICFVSNGSWLDGNSQDGFRKHLEKEFSTIYIFNTRGNARTQGELRRKEAGNVFGSGSRTPISITLLVKNPDNKHPKANIYYYDIGDYLNREEKLQIIKDFESVSNQKFNWLKLTPNDYGDWINERNDLFDTFISLAPEEKYNSKTNSFFIAYTNGLASGRDYFVYNSSKSTVIQKVGEMLDFYNDQTDLYKLQKKSNPKLRIKDFVKYDSTKISWTDIFLRDSEKGIKYSFDEKRVGEALYRPFFKQFLCYNKTVIHRTYQLPKIYPELNTRNLIIVVTGKGASKDFSTLITDVIPNYHTLDTDQCFSLYYYEENKHQQKSLFDTSNDSKYIRRDGVSDFIYEQAKKIYGKNVTKEDIFFYVYGFLHSNHYRLAFANDLKKMLPRIPLVDAPKDFWKFSKAGRELSELHINYESIPPFEGVVVRGAESGFYTVEKMRFPRKGQKDTIIYNSRITIENIPEKAYDYVVNGKSAIEWIMERYQVTVDKNSGIKNDPNDWADEVGKPSYILDLLLSIINVSIQTVDIVNSLPELKFET